MSCSSCPSNGWCYIQVPRSEWEEPNFKSYGANLVVKGAQCKLDTYISERISSIVINSTWIQTVIPPINVSELTTLISLLKLPAVWVHVIMFSKWDIWWLAGISCVCTTELQFGGWLLLFSSFKQMYLNAPLKLWYLTNGLLLEQFKAKWLLFTLNMAFIFVHATQATSKTTLKLK